MSESKKCAKCGKSLKVWDKGYDSNEVYYMDFRHEVSLDQRFPEHTYKGKKLCASCYQEIWSQAPIIPKSITKVTDKNALSIPESSSSILRIIVAGVFFIAFLLLIVGVVSISQSIWKIMGFWEIAQIVFMILIGLCTFLLASFVVSDGEKFMVLNQQLSRNAHDQIRNEERIQKLEEELKKLKFP